MPAKLNVNWNEVQMLAQQVGVREAARRMGIPEDAAKQRSSREGWMKNLPRSTPLPPTMLRAVPGVTDGAKAAATAMRDRLVKTRMNHADVALLASAEMLRAAEESPERLLDPQFAGVVFTHGKHASLTGGWQNVTAIPKIDLTLTAQTPKESEIPGVIEAQWSDSEPVE